MDLQLQRLRFVDLFAGIGGFHQAWRRLGAQLVFASEWDKRAAQTYFANYGTAPHGDITQIHASQIPAHDVLCAGFPCQAFSISGKQKGFEDTRGTLFFDIARIVCHHRPAVVFLENVKNFVKHDGGRTLAVALATLDDLGYATHYQILNASDFGLPQNRERVYIVAFRKDLQASFAFPKPPKKAVALQDILEKDPIGVPFVERADTVFYRDFLLATDKNGKALLPNRPIQIGKIGKGGQGERIYHPLGHAITLSAYGGGVGAKTGLYLIDGKVRKLSARECARAQGFPDSFQIVASKSQAYRQFGNSVAVNVVVAIAQQILQSLAKNQ